MPRSLPVLEGGRGYRQPGILEAGTGQGSHGIRGGKWVRIGSTVDLPLLIQHGLFLLGKGRVTEAQEGQTFS